jgi:hypothetical protein
MMTLETLDTELAELKKSREQMVENFRAGMLRLEGAEMVLQQLRAQAANPSASPNGSAQDVPPTPKRNRKKVE